MTPPNIAALDEVREALEAMEYVGQSSRCLYCDRDADRGHQDGCRVADALTALEAALQAKPAEDRPSPLPADDIGVNNFARAMSAKLAFKRAEGYYGWNDKARCSQEYLSARLRMHVDKGDPVDVANFAMMLHQRGERISAAPAVTALDDAGLREILAQELEKIGWTDTADILRNGGVAVYNAPPVDGAFNAMRRAAASVTDGWRAIESAPKDKSVILWQPSSFTIDSADGTELARCGAGAYSGYWDSLDEAWCLSGATWLGPFLEPTHWHPLPTPPSHARDE